MSTLVFYILFIYLFANNALLYTHRAAHIHSRELPKPATVFYCWLPSSSISTVGGVAACSKAPRKSVLGKGESLLIHVCCTHIFPAGPETKLGNCLTQAVFAQVKATAAPSLSFPSVCALYARIKLLHFPSFSISFLSFFSFSCKGGSAGV